MVEVIAIIVLGVLVIAQAVERYLFGRHMTNELSKAIKAVMSRNINEYIAATQVDKKTDAPFVEDDEVDLTEADDKTYDKFIQKQTN